MIRTMLTVAYILVLLVVLAIAWVIYTVFRQEKDASRIPILSDIQGKKWDAYKHHHGHGAAQAEAGVAAPAVAETPAGEDDLKRIEGIGPVMERVLNEAGITTFADLAARTPAELRAILDAAGVRRITNPETWPEQAKLAAEGRWEELAALQSTLKGGRRMM